MKWYLAAFGLILFGCGPKPDYEAALKTAIPERTKIEVHVHLFQSVRDLEKVVGPTRHAMAKWSPNDNRCDIYIKQGDTKSLGHEMQHCIFGSWHPE